MFEHQMFQLQLFALFPRIDDSCVYDFTMADLHGS